MKAAVKFLAMTLILCEMSGCMAFRRSITDKKPEDASTLTAMYDQRDMLQWGKLISEDIINHPFMKSNDKPFIADLGIQNRTQIHMDMQSLADTITTGLLDSGKVRLANTSDRDKMLKEQGFQLANCTMDTRVKIGKLLGAKYMMTGALMEMSQQSGKEVRVSKQKDVYYQLTIKITDLETGEVVMAKQRDRLRRESKPLIGW